MVVFGTWYLVVHVDVCKTAEITNIQLLDRIGGFTDKLKPKLVVHVKVGVVVWCYSTNLLVVVTIPLHSTE